MARTDKAAIAASVALPILGNLINQATGHDSNNNAPTPATQDASSQYDMKLVFGGVGGIVCCCSCSCLLILLLGAILYSKKRS